MSIEKISSLASREMREGEIEGYTYYFKTKKFILNELKEDRLMQFIKLNNELYGYEKIHFKNIDHLIIISAPSGSGKDSTFDYIKENPKYEIEENIKYLFSVPDTVPVFIDYCNQNNIKFTIININVKDKERLRRILKGNLLKLKTFTDTLDNDSYGKVLKVVVDDDLEITILGMINHELLCFNKLKDVSRVIKDSLNRFNRDDKLFKKDLKILKEKNKVLTLDCNSLNIEKVSDLMFKRF